MKNERRNQIERLAKFLIWLGVLGNLVAIGLVSAGEDEGLMVFAVSCLTIIAPAFHLQMKRGLQEAEEQRALKEAAHRESYP